MDNSSDQIQADIERTRARMSAGIDNVGYNRSSTSGYSQQGSSDYGRSGMSGYSQQSTSGYNSATDGTNLVSNISEEIRRRPLLALGISLLAGSLLKDVLGGDQASSRSTAGGSRPGYTGYTTGSAYGSQYGAGTTVRQGVSTAADRAGDAMQSAGQMASDAVGSVANTASNAAGAVADTASNAASAVADTTVNVARQVADTTGDVVNQVVETAGDARDQVVETAGDLFSIINRQVREHPLLAVGVGLYAGSLLSGRLGGGQTGGSTQMSTRPTYQQYGSVQSTYSYSPVPTYGSQYGAGTTVRQGVSTAADRAGNAVRSAGQTVGDTAEQVVDTAVGAASAVADTASNAASAVADTASNAASAVADTTVNVARQVADTTGDVVNQVVETAGDARDQVVETAGDLFSTIRRQVYDRPLLTLGAAIGAGMYLQPMLAPYVTNVTDTVRRPVRNVTNAVVTDVAQAEPDELDRIRQAVVPAAVERARQLTTREMRDYLEKNLEGVLGQTALRAGVVAAVSEKAEGLVENRLAGILERNLSGTQGLVLLGLTGAFLRAFNQAQQGSGQTVNNLTTNLVSSITQGAREQLQTYFPEFRQHYESTTSSPRRCTNCNSEIPEAARFCPTCGLQV